MVIFAVFIARILINKKNDPLYKLALMCKPVYLGLYEKQVYLYTKTKCLSRRELFRELKEFKRSIIFRKRDNIVILRNTVYIDLINRYRIMRVLLDSRGVYMDLVLTNTEELKIILSELYQKRFYIKVVKLFRLNEYFVSLTDKQVAILLTAYREGFFDYPKSISLSELSKILGRSVSTINEHIKKSLRKIIQQYLIANLVT